MLCILKSLNVIKLLINDISNSQTLSFPGSICIAASDKIIPIAMYPRINAKLRSVPRRASSSLSAIPRNVLLPRCHMLCQLGSDFNAKTALWSSWLFANAAINKEVIVLNKFSLLTSILFIVYLRIKSSTMRRRIM